MPRCKWFSRYGAPEWRQRRNSAQFLAVAAFIFHSRVEAICHSLRFASAPERSRVPVILQITAAVACLRCPEKWLSSFWSAVSTLERVEVGGGWRYLQEVWTQQAVAQLWQGWLWPRGESLLIVQGWNLPAVLQRKDVAYFLPHSRNSFSGRFRCLKRVIFGEF